MAFFNLKLLLKSKYFRKSIIIKSLYLLPTKITVAHFDEKPVFRPNLALLKGPKWSFGQNWTYLIWLNMVWDSHSTHDQYLISRFLGEFRVLKNCFQPGVLNSSMYLTVSCVPSNISSDPKLVTNVTTSTTTLNATCRFVVLFIFY